MQTHKLIRSVLFLVFSAIFWGTPAKSQQIKCYKYNLTFDVTNCFSNTAPLNNIDNYTEVNCPLEPTPCDNGDFFCGFKAVTTIGPLTAQDIQFIINTIKDLADLRKTTCDLPLLRHNENLNVTITGGISAIVTLYLRSDPPTFADMISI